MTSLASAPMGSAVERLRAGVEELSQRDQRVARFCIDHAEEVPFLSAGELAGRLGISGAAITRFSQRIGYDGYPHFQKTVRHDLRATLGLKQPGPQNAVVADFWASERANLESLAALPEQQLLPFAQAIAQARRVWIVGARSSYGLALMAEALLSSFRPRVEAHSADLLLSRPEQFLELTAEDAVLVYTMRRYSRATTQVVTALHERGVTVLLLTDQGASPLGKLARHCLRLPTQGSEAAASVAPFVSITSLMIVLVARAWKGDHFKQTEALKAEFGVYEY
ncbi:MurR/RpiR family transcriptional regulator (plasmid) [Deinococcus psychrotolerans]|uniref:MurR/RpiR family transcriptional regulator n=1 Tax=Deinococcus psychrotolerans TaxID=2489213 RepID=A0A3G8YQ52_9DEIO|nr:MurR/RpiR family transcriptional regulator [Deinococcus psychrotolerans]AZI44714.1 MurR/RpiR family transcriptional regulator [Deinococcus psychrotolerans]